jgi:hypothetical protein
VLECVHTAAENNSDRSHSRIALDGDVSGVTQAVQFRRIVRAKYLHFTAMCTAEFAEFGEVCTTKRVIVGEELLQRSQASGTAVFGLHLAVMKVRFAVGKSGKPPA